MTPARVRIGVEGDVDATDRRPWPVSSSSIPVSHSNSSCDLSRVDFFGSQGFAALHYISVQCARRDVDWMIVGNRAVRRILRICDSDTVLPVVNNIDAALTRLDRCSKYRHSGSGVG